MTLRVGASLGGGGGGGPPSGGPFVPLDGSVPMTGRLTTGGNGITYSNVGPAFSGHDISFGWSGSAIAYFVDNIFLDTILGQTGAGQTYVQLSGGIPMTGPLQVPGVVIEEYLVDTPNDLSHHISLYLWYGFSVSAFRLNYVSNGSHVFLFQETDLFSISEGGVVSNVPVTLPADPTQPLEAATKQYVDNAVAPLLARIAELEAAAR